MSKQHYIGQYLFFIDEEYAAEKGNRKINYPYLIKQVDSGGAVFTDSNNRCDACVTLPTQIECDNVRVEKKIQPNDYCFVLDTPNVNVYSSGISVGKIVQFTQYDIDRYYESEITQISTAVCIYNIYRTNYLFGDLRLATQAEIDFHTGRIEASNPAELRPEPIRQEERIEIPEIPIAFTPQVGDVCKYLGDGLNSYLVKGDYYTIERIDRFVYLIGKSDPFAIDWFNGSRGCQLQFLRLSQAVSKITGVIEDKIQWKPTNKDQKLTYLQEQLVRCILYKPEALRSYIAKSSNPGYSARFVKSLFPTRVGYEFDTAGRDDDVLNWLKQLEARSNKFAKSKKNKPFLWVDNSGDHVNHKSKANELRFSTTSVFQLKTLKELCIRLNASKNVNPAEDGGLHIHVNLEDIVGIKLIRSSRMLNQVKKERGSEFRNYKEYIYDVFEVPGRKTSEGKAIRDGNDVFKRVRIMRNLPTVEWRIANTTFSYDKLVKWTIFTHLMTETIKKPNKKFNKALFEKIMLVE